MPGPKRFGISARPGCPAASSSRVVDLDPGVENGSSGAERRCRRRASRAASSRSEPGAAVLAHVVADVLDAEQGCLGPSELAPACDPRHVAALESIRQKKLLAERNTRLPPQVAVALDDVVLALGHVLVVPGEDDQVVARRSARRSGARSSSACERTSTALAACG